LEKVFKIIGITLLSVFGLLVSCVSMELKDTEGNIIKNSMVERNFIEIGGMQQGFFLRSENPENPVILYLHGGPGSPELAFLYRYEKEERLEKYFTVCYWDQRGTGMSFNNSIDPSTMTLEQMVEDTRQITEYLMRRFNKEKIYLMGHSWGTYLGIKTIEKYPENYLAYIGIGQVTNQVESERLAYDYMLRYAMEINDRSAVRKLQKYDKNASEFPTLEYISNVRTPLMNKYGIGLMHGNFSMARIVRHIINFSGYTLSEKLKITRGISFSLKYLLDYFIYDNLFETSISFQVPVYILHGIYDYQVSYVLAQEYYEIIEAPDKSFYTFEYSAHSPNAEEPERFVQIVCDIVTNIGN